MNLGLLTTFIVGGLMLLSILMFNISTYNSTVETTSSVITQNKMDNIVEVLQNDLNRIAYDVPLNLVTAFINTQNDRVSFRGNIFDNDASSTYDFVEWKLTNVKDTSTSNPNDYILTRTWNPNPGNPITEVVSTYSARYFNVNYFNSDGNAPASIDKIVQLEVELVIESGEPFNVNNVGDKNYYRTVWKRRIVLNNILIEDTSR